MNAGILTLSQAVGVIMGANIGTTITRVAGVHERMGRGLKAGIFRAGAHRIAPSCCCSRRRRGKKKRAVILAGFGILFIGLSFMSGAITPYKDAPIFGQIFTVLGSNPIFGILAGVIVTGIIQSSSAPWVSFRPRP